MTRRFNVEEAQRALDAAARDAKTGQREVRAGRFVPTAPKPPTAPRSLPSAKVRRFAP